MIKLGLIALVFLLVVVPFVSADVIAPGFKPIHIENKITNLNDYPDYVFVSVGTLGGKYSPGMCPVQTIGNNGIIESYYKFCDVIIYAIKNSDFDHNVFRESRSMNSSQREEYAIGIDEFLSSDKAIKVLDNLDVYKEVPVSSTQESISYEHTVNLSSKNVISQKDVERNNLFYVYIIIPLIALIIIIFVLVRRQRKA